MAVSSLTIRPMADTSLLADFHCGIQAMDKFIHSGLSESIRNHYCNSYSVFWALIWLPCLHLVSYEYLKYNGTLTVERICASSPITLTLARWR